VGPDNNPDLGATIDTNRSDFIFPGTPNVHVALDSLYLYKFGGALDAAVGIPDLGFVKYGGSLSLVVSPHSCGVFTFEFDPDISYSWLAYVDQFLVILPRLEELTIHVCEDDGLYCNGLEPCDAEIGCEIVPPPNCDDGIVCTIDSCDETAPGCVHALNHGTCDDGYDCTRDECTATGCIHVADQCRAIPTTSQWGLVILAICLMVASKLRLRIKSA
jgi:hypothetical protein